MRDILISIDTNFWQQFSGIFFGVAFTILIAWVCLPSRKEVYERHSKLPLDAD